MDQNVNHLELHLELHVQYLNFTLKGGPPWGFRIKQRRDRVIVSKVSIHTFIDLVLFDTKVLFLTIFMIS